MCGWEKFRCRNFMFSSGFWAPASMCQSPLSLLPEPHYLHHHLPLLQKPHFRAACSIAEQRDVRSQAHQQLGPVSLCCGAFLVQVSVNGVSRVQQQTVQRHKPAGLLQLICSTVRRERKAKENFNFICVLNVNCRVSPYSALSDRSSSVITSAYTLTCMGMHTHT